MPALKPGRDIDETLPTMSDSHSITDGAQNHDGGAGLLILNDSLQHLILYKLQFRASVTGISCPHLDVSGIGDSLK